MFTVRKAFQFEAAHILASAYSKVCCASIHGHSYVVEVFLRTKELNKDGMVMDFGELKALIGGLIEKWDHALILPPTGFGSEGSDITGGAKTVYFPVNPTAEHMALNLFNRIAPLIGPVFDNSGEEIDAPYLWKVRVHETTTGWAEYERDRA